MVALFAYWRTGGCYSLQCADSSGVEASVALFARQLMAFGPQRTDLLPLARQAHKDHVAGKRESCPVSNRPVDGGWIGDSDDEATEGDRKRGRAPSADDRKEAKKARADADVHLQDTRRLMEEQKGTLTTVVDEAKKQEKKQEKRITTLQDKLEGSDAELKRLR
jgi:hypothetical protein